VNRVRIFAARLLGLFGRRSREAELDSELRTHLEMAAEENVRRGMSAEEARYAARREFGGVEQMKETYRERRGLPVIETFLQDLRFAARMLRKNPGFTAIAILTLALGIGANTAIFSVIDAVLIRALPFPAADRLIWANARFPLGDSAMVSPPDFADYRAQTRSFDQFAAMGFLDSSANLIGGDKPEQVLTNFASWNFFDALGIRPVLGRSFVPDDEQAALPQVAILGHGIWVRRFGSDPAIIGRKISLDGRPVTVVGVLPTDLPLLSEAEVWSPAPMLNSGMTNRGFHFMVVVGRLKPGVGIEQARADLDATARQLGSTYPATDKEWSLRVRTLREAKIGSVKPALLMLLCSVGLLLLVACSNVANLLLARATARRREIAVRGALGAGRWRLVRQMLTESMLLALGGGAMGILAAVWGVHGLRILAPADLPRLDQVAVNGPVLAFTAALSVLTGIAFGLAPALQLSRVNIEETLREAGRSTGRIARHRAGNALVIGEVAMSLCLLVCGGLLLRSFWRLAHTDPGFRADRVITAKLNLPDAAYNDVPRRVAFFRQLEDRVTALPGVSAAGAISELPLNGEYGDSFFTVVGRSYPPPPNQFDDADLRKVTPGYLAAMRIPLLSGRWFDDRDSTTAPGVIVVNDAFARRYFPGQDPIGKHLQGVGGNIQIREIVGVIGTTRHNFLGENPRPEMYLPFAQSGMNRMSLIVRAAGDPSRLAPALQDTVSSIDKDLPLSTVRSMDDIVSASIAEPRFSAQLLGLFAALALVLAGVGLYGLIAYTVTQQTREIGIRMALGAASRDILRMVLTRGLRLTLVGVAIGLAAALGLARLLQGLLFAVNATDPLTFVGVGALLIIVALIACWLPARRAIRVAPMVALRHE
jgi:putative ABC transport system permease protein